MSDDSVNQAFVEGYVDATNKRDIATMLTKAITLLTGESADCPYGKYGVCPRGLADQCVLATAQRTANEVTDCWVSYLNTED